MSKEITEQIADYVWDRLDQQTDDRLSEIIAECALYTSGSCDWVTFKLKDIVTEVADSLLRIRCNRRVPRT